MRIYAIARGSRDGDTTTQLKMAWGEQEAIEVINELASAHIAYVLAGESDVQQFVDKINSAISIAESLACFNEGMQAAHDREVENAYSAEIVVEMLEV